MGIHAVESGTELVLASASPRRRELISLLGLPVRIVPSHADESTPEEWQPVKIVEELALRKALAVRDAALSDAAPERGTIVVGSDTIVVLDGEVMGKPKDGDDAARMLRKLSGRTHEVWTGVACVRASEERSVKPENASAAAAATADAAIDFGGIGRYRLQALGTDGAPLVAVGHTVSKVTFRPMTDTEIHAYVASGEPLDKAGSYGVQSLGAVYVEKIDGDFYSIMGLPVNLLYAMLGRFGVARST